MNIFFITAGVIRLCRTAAFAGEPQNTYDIFEFFSQEAKIITASRIPASRQRSPATVYVVTGQEIKDSGAQNIWDALRGLPGVDVIQPKAGQGEVSIRGLGQPGNTRTMILLDGRKALNSFSDYITWADLPVTLQEIDRIEVVQGPASAIYGANAINGAINIITKTPDKFQGGQLSNARGERGAQLAGFDYGRQLDKWSYRFGGGWERVNSSGHADELSARDGKASLAAAYRPDENSELNISGGLTQMNAQLSTAESIGDFFNKGKNGFIETTYRNRQTSYKAYWVRYDIDLIGFPALGDVAILSDTYVGEAWQTLTLPFNNEAALGASYKYDTTRSEMTARRVVRKSWGATLEDRWDISDKWLLQAAARVDEHPHMKTMLSSRGSLIFAPAGGQSVRLSAGTAFRPPTLVHNFIDTTLRLPNPGTVVPKPPISTMVVKTTGDTGLKPESIKTAELAYSGTLGPIEAGLTGFYYKIRDMLLPGPNRVTSISVPTGTAYVSSTYINGGDIQAWGGELALTARLAPWLSSYANYSYQRLKNLPGPDIESPLNKVNAGLRAKSRGWTWDIQGYWTDITRRTQNAHNPAVPSDLATIHSYVLVNAHAGYAFKDRLDGLEAGVSVFNLLNHDHYEALPEIASAAQGQSAEIMRQRCTAELSYRF